MSADPLAAIGAVHRAAAGLAKLGSTLAGAAPDGQFAAVFSQVNSDLEAIRTGGSSSPAASAASAAQPVGAGLFDISSAAGAPSSSEAVHAAFDIGSPGDAAATGPAQSPGSVVADAERYLGVPYQWGGTDPSTGLDCSGLVQRVYSDLGVQLPRTSQEQASAGVAVPSLAGAQPGDLVFYEPSASGPGHVGIYIGNGQMIDAPHTGTVVRVDPVGQPVAIRRILPGSSGAMSSLGAPAALQPLFSEAGHRYGVDPVLLAAVAKQESGFQPGAVSGAGAEGLMQLMPATAAGLGVSPFDPASAIDGAAQLLSGYLHDYGGSVPMALAAYNAGPNAVATYGGVPPYAETQGYVASITSMLNSAQKATL